MHDGDPIREDGGAAAQKAERGELGARNLLEVVRWGMSHRGLGNERGHGGTSFHVPALFAADAVRRQHRLGCATMRVAGG
jgi:hypothetical protein